MFDDAQPNFWEAHLAICTDPQHYRICRVLRDGQRYISIQHRRPTLPLWW